MSQLRLTARCEDRNASHARIGVFQNGGKAGVLTVDADHADAIIGLIAAAPDLLAACEQTLRYLQCTGTHTELVNLLNNAIAKATTTTNPKEMP